MDVYHTKTEQFVTKSHKREKGLFEPPAFVTRLEHNLSYLTGFYYNVSKFKERFHKNIFMC